MLIAAILLVFLCMLISLFAGLYFLFSTKVDDKISRSTQGNKKTSDPLLTSLSFRVALAGLLIALLTFGFLTGQLGNHAPWATQGIPEQAEYLKPNN